MQIFVFPGEGAQTVGMGRELFDKIAEFRYLENAIDRVLGYSIRTLCLEDPGRQLKEPRFLHPALYTVNALYYWDKKAKGLSPDGAAGHGLGEYNALFAAGVFNFLTGLSLVQRRGELMAEEKNGAMAAVIGMEPARVAEVLTSHRLNSVDITNYNSPEQSVISGRADDIKRAIPILEQARARVVIQLPVNAAFHSRYMGSIASTYKKFLSTFEFKAPSIPVIANVTAAPYPAESEAIKTLLAAQIRLPVRWTQSIERLIESGASRFEEVGPGSGLTKFIHQIAG